MADAKTDVPEMDYPAHYGTYHRFIAGVKYSIFGLALLLVLMAAFL